MTTTSEPAHAEAFCLMTYEADDGSEREVIWNSRDGVTPFVITLRSGKTARHVDWHADRRVVDHRPAPGSRMFVDLTPERALERARRNAAGWWADDIAGCRSRWDSEEAMAQDLAKEYLHPAGSPDLVEVSAASDAVLDSSPVEVWPGRRGDGDIAMGISVAATEADEPDARKVGHDFVIQMTGGLRAGPVCWLTLPADEGQERLRAAGVELELPMLVFLRRNPDARIVVAMCATDAPGGGS